MLGLVTALCPAAVAGVYIQLGTAPNTEGHHFWMEKNGNALRTGQSVTLRGPQALSNASWVFEAPFGASFYQSPVIDRDGNSYVTANGPNIMYSFTRSGKIRWSKPVSSKPFSNQIPTPVLVGDALYTADGAGSMVSMSLDTGDLRWRRAYSVGSGADSWSIGVNLEDGLLYTIGFMKEEEKKLCMYGGTYLYAISISDGATKWTHKLSGCNCNIMPAVASDTLIYSDAAGAVTALKSATGEPIWHRESPAPKSFTTGTAAMGPNGLVFVTSNRGNGQGLLRAFNAQTGETAWEHTFDAEANAAPAVYKDRAGTLRVAMGIGNNAGLPPLHPVLDKKTPHEGWVYSFDADTGAVDWIFQPETWNHQACAGSTTKAICLPDAWTNPSIDSVGTLYIGWHGGKIFALDTDTGRRISEYDIRSGTQGEPAIGDGMLVAISCQRIAGFNSAL